MVIPATDMLSVLSTPFEKRWKGRKREREEGQGREASAGVATQAEDTRRAALQGVHSARQLPMARPF